MLAFVIKISIMRPLYGSKGLWLPSLDFEWQKEHLSFQSLLLRKKGKVREMILRKWRSFLILHWEKQSKI